MIKRKEIPPFTEIYQEFLKELPLKGEDNSGYQTKNCMQGLSNKS